jgi:hypothetical protein
MGFRLNQRTYLLKFEDSAMEGAEIRLRSTPISTLLRLGETVPYAELVELLCEYVLDWNLEDSKGEPLKVEVEAILDNIEEVMLTRIVREWYRAAKGITAPLDPPSTDGEQFKEETSLDLSEIPMQALDAPEN